MCFFLQILYIYRNPKDVLISFFHFSNWVATLEATETIEHYLEKFLDGKGNYIYSLSLVYKTQMTFKASQSRNMYLRDRGGRRSLERVITRYTIIILPLSGLFEDCQLEMLCLYYLGSTLARPQKIYKYFICSFYLMA